MKKQLSIFIFISAFFISTAFAEASAAAGQELESLLSKFTTYQALFKQVTKNRAGKTIKKGSGRVMISRPGKFRWETHKPSNQVLIAKGQTLWILDLDLSQATKRTISSHGAVNPAMLLTGKAGSVLSRFRVTKVTRNDRLWYRLQPKKENDAFHFVEMHFSRARLQQVRILNEMGDITTFTFSHIVVNRPIKAAYFNFTAPQGVEVVK